jgi:hypothetical protein
VSLPSFHEWLFVNVDWRISSGAMKGQRYTFDAFPCIEALVRDNSHEQVVMKSAQMALSEQYTLQRPLYHLDVHGRNWGIMFPTQATMRNFYKSRIQGALAANPIINGQTLRANEDSIDVFGRSLYLRYTTSEGAIATFDADGITIDEADIHNPDTLYGAKTSRRQGAMGKTFWYEISTPTYPNHGVHLSFANSDQHIWLIKCAGCGSENDLTSQIGPYDASDADKFFREYLSESAFPDSRDFAIPCVKCGKGLDLVTPLDPSNPSFGGGRWVPRYEDRDTRGYHIQIFQRLYEGGSPAVLARVRESLLGARKTQHVRRWWNFTIGVPYVPAEGRLTDSDLALATTNAYREWSPIYGRTMFGLAGEHADWMGVDVREGQYHVFCLKRLPDGTKMVSAVGWVPTSSDLRALWDRLGRPHFIMDSEPDLNESRTLVNAMGRRAYRGKFSQKLGALWAIGSDKNMVVVKRPAVMESVKSEILEGGWIFPTESWGVGAGIVKRKGSTEEEETLSRHFKAPTMVEVEVSSTGAITYDFPKSAMGGVDPHFYMAACLAWVATEMKSAPAFRLRVPR